MRESEKAERMSDQTKAAINHQGGEVVMATRSGRWGVRQIDRHGDNTGGGTVGVGWATRDEAEKANPPQAGYTFEPFERWSDR